MGSVIDRSRKQGEIVGSSGGKLGEVSAQFFRGSKDRKVELKSGPFEKGQPV